MSNRIDVPIEITLWRCRSTFNTPPLFDTNNSQGVSTANVKLLGGENDFAGPLRLNADEPKADPPKPEKRGDLSLRRGGSSGKSSTHGNTPILEWGADTYHLLTTC